MNHENIEELGSRTLLGLKHGMYCLAGKIEDREVNSLFDCKESYSGSIILLQEREDIQA